MPLKLICPSCRKALTLPDQLAGRTGKCPACGASITVPASASPVTPPPPPPASFASPQPAPVVEATPILTATLVSSTPFEAIKEKRAGFFAKRSRRFWIGTTVGIIFGLYVVSMLLELGTAAVQDARRRTESSSGPAADTILARFGYGTGDCLVCRTSRSPAARRQYSDDHGYGLCERCGAGHQAMTSMAGNGGFGSPGDQQAAQKFMQTMQQHLGPNPSDEQRTVFIGLMSFDSPEWNSAFGPVEAAKPAPALPVPSASMNKPRYQIDIRNMPDFSPR